VRLRKGQKISLVDLMHLGDGLVFGRIKDGAVFKQSRR
jgi:hypothetical protein